MEKIAITNLETAQAKIIQLEKELATKTNYLHQHQEELEYTNSLLDEVMGELEEYHAKLSLLEKSQPMSNDNINQVVNHDAWQKTQNQLYQALELLEKYQQQLDKTMAVVEKLSLKSNNNQTTIQSNIPNQNGIKRVYIRGCPRSGNTLMLYLCDVGFANSHILTNQCIPTIANSDPDKITFATLPSPEVSPEKQLQAKNFLDQPDSAIIFMVRDPRDVLVSEHGQKPGEPWIKNPQKWINNALILEKLQSHPRVIVVKYEDLVSKPNQIQKEIAEKLGFKIAMPFRKGWQNAKLTPQATKSLNGLRPLETIRIGNWQDSFQKKNYVEIQLQKYPQISNIMNRLGYDNTSAVSTFSTTSADQQQTSQLLAQVNKKPTFHLKAQPLITPEAVVFIEQFCQIHNHPHILEFGSGGSTVWLSKLTKNLVSIEHDRGWYQKVKHYLNNEPTCYPVDLKLLAKPYDYVCNQFPDEFFDLIIVDGRDRVKCLTSSVRILKQGGIMMMDDAQRERYQEAHRLLKDWPFTCTVSPARETHWWKKVVKK